MNGQSVFAMLFGAGVLTACGPEVPELPEDTRFDSPAGLSAPDSRDLVRILNERRGDWEPYRVTLPSGVDADIRFSLPGGASGHIAYYRPPAQGGCSMIGFWPALDGVYATGDLPPAVCRRLDAILIPGAAQG